MVFETLRVARQGAVLFADIAVPPMNLLGPALVRDLVSLIQRSEADQALRVLVFRSADPDYFIAHVDGTLPPEEWAWEELGAVLQLAADEYLEVHHRGASDADVTEGSGGIWERLHYDWADRSHVVMKTTDSNLRGGKSGHTYTFTRRPDGTTEVDAVVVRDGKNLRGWALGLVLGTVGKGVLEKAFRNTIKTIEARNGDGQATPRAT